MYGSVVRNIFRAYTYTHMDKNLASIQGSDWGLVDEWRPLFVLCGDNSQHRMINGQ